MQLQEGPMKMWDSTKALKYGIFITLNKMNILHCVVIKDRLSCLVVGNHECFALRQQNDNHARWSFPFFHVVNELWY